MKPSLLLLTLSLSIGVYWVSDLTSVRANTTGSKFYCGQSKNVPATMAKTSRGAVPVIRWVSTLGETYTPENRCKIVSEKFQTFYNDGTLNYLTTGTVNQLPVICAAQRENGPCTGVLFTLKPNSDPGRTLQRLLSIRDRAPGAVLNESSPQVYVNMADFLSTAPTDAEQSSINEVISVPTPGGSTSTPNGNRIW
jgi:Circadian oscillating protein COP23